MCKYNGKDYELCPNNEDGVCMTIYPTIEAFCFLYHKFDDKNYIKCLCGWGIELSDKLNSMLESIKENRRKMKSIYQRGYIDGGIDMEKKWKITVKELTEKRDWIEWN